jgi:predicted MFS family arabinose efflux permease
MSASLRNNRSFRMLLGGSTVSALGSRVTTIAYPMLMLWLTRSPVYAGCAVFAAIAPSLLFYLPAGMLVDRWENPRLTMLLAELGRGLAVTLIIFTVLLYRSFVPLIIVFAAIEETLEVFVGLAERRYVMDVVGPEDACSALVRTEARTHVTVLAGRPLGGLLFEASPVLPFLADSLSFIVSVCALLKTEHVNYSASAEEPQSSQDVFAGLKWLAGDDFGRYAIPLTAFMTLIAQSVIIIFISDAESGRLPSLEVGLVLAASGAGGVLGAFIGVRVRFLLKYSRLAIQLATWAAALLALSVATASSSEWWMALVMLMFSFTGAVSNIELDTYVTKKAPSMLARVTSVSRLFSLAACAVGPVAGGFLVGTQGTHHAVIALSMVTLALGVFAWSVPSIRSAHVSLVGSPANRLWSALCRHGRRIFTDAVRSFKQAGRKLTDWANKLRPVAESPAGTDDSSDVDSVVRLDGAAGVTISQLAAMNPHCHLSAGR